MSTAPVNEPREPVVLSVERLLAEKETRPIASVDHLAAGTFASDDELGEFLRFTRAERRRDAA